MNQQPTRPTLPLFFRRSLAALALAVAVPMASGCLANFGGDRCYVTPERHEAARRLYERSGSLDLTREQLVEADWLSCEIEQTIYRLANENSPSGEE